MISRKMWDSHKLIIESLINSKRNEIILKESDQTGSWGSSTIKIELDINKKSNSQAFVKSLLFAKKQFGISKLLELVPAIQSTNNDQELRATYMKIFPVFFSYAELSTICVPECLSLISKIKRQPFFAKEKGLFDGWQTRLKALLINPIEYAKDRKENENKFVNIPGTDCADIIGYAELDLFFRYHKWLKYHKLHKYLYFFANLSYAEIQNISAKNINDYENKVDLFPMTTGARNAILRKLGELNQRSNRLETFCKEEYYQNTSKIEKSINEIKAILKTPIRRNQVYSKSNLPDLLNNAIETVISVVLQLPKEEALKVYEVLISLLKMAWGCNFFEIENKNKFNLWQIALSRKIKSRKLSKDINNNNTTYITQQFDIEYGIQCITLYLENVLLQEN